MEVWIPKELTKKEGGSKVLKDKTVFVDGLDFWQERVLTEHMLRFLSI